MALQEIDPTYCEPTYWMGVTHINAGRPAAGVAALEEALGCKYVAADALQALNKVLALLASANPSDGAALVVSSYD